MQSAQFSTTLDCEGDRKYNNEDGNEICFGTFQLSAVGKTMNGHHRKEKIESTLKRTNQFLVTETDWKQEMRFFLSPYKMKQTIATGLEESTPKKK